jgi:uncharacterized RDD family membrane protein YckC
MSSADRYTLETPENIEVEFELAGPGSRFCALLIDTLYTGLIVLALGLLLLLLGLAVLPFGGRTGEWLLAVMWVIVAVLISDFYYILFELLMRGQTPGKKVLKIRVLREDGTPVTANEVLVRNIIRLVDFLPVGYVVGAVVMFMNPLWKRLGDVAAGTIVVKERQLDYRARADKKSPLHVARVGVVNADPLHAGSAVALNAELTAGERRLLTGFLQRRIELLPQARDELARRLAQPLYDKYGGHYDTAESYLERLGKGRHYES